MSTRHRVSCLSRGASRRKAVTPEFATGMFETYELPPPKPEFATCTFDSVCATTPKPQRVKFAAGIRLMCCPRRSIFKNAASLLPKVPMGRVLAQNLFQKKSF